MAKAYRIEVIDHTENEHYRSVGQAAPFLGTTDITLFKYRKLYGDRFCFRGHDIELIPTQYIGAAKRVKCVETGEEYNSSEEAGKALGVTGGAVRSQILGKSRSVKGLHFRGV